jgi:hypothetical protein
VDGATSTNASDDFLKMLTAVQAKHERVLEQQVMKHPAD